MARTNRNIILLNDNRTVETPHVFSESDGNPKPRTLVVAGVQYELAFTKADGTLCYAPAR